VVNVMKHGWELQVAGCGLQVAGCGFIRLLIALMIHIVEIASPPFVVFLGYWLFAHRLFREALSVSWRMHFAKLGAGPYRLLVFRHNLAVKQMHRSLRVLGESAVMGNHANGCSTLMQLGEKLHDCVPVLAVQIPGWFICQ
jgi:hypothetical protein